MKFLKALVPAILCFSPLCADYKPIYEGSILAEFREYISIVQSLLPENPVVIEAGAHYGTETKKFADIWPQGSIYAFEPNPGAFSKLFMATLNCKNVKTLPIALAEYDGEATMHVCYGSTGDNPIFEGASSLLEPADYMKVHYQGPHVKVPCCVLDHWCEENGIDHVDFIWFDLEGMELQVLKSSPKILSTVKILVVETNFQEFRHGMTQYQPLKQFLEKSGFTLLCHTYVEGLQGDAIFIKKVE
jgi:FkbM family methyltransferase